MYKAARRLGLVFFPAFDWAISPTHPEREERLLYTLDQVLEEGILDIDGIYEYRPRLATVADVERVHVCVPDVMSRITESHLIAAGGAIVAAEAVLKGEVDKAFAVVRPPGHHAMRIVHGARGFCNINIEAIMIEYIRRNYGKKRIAIVDTDCHHGDGSQDIYWHDPDTLYISIHQDGRTLYPGSGFLNEFGGPNAYGYNLNLPLPPETGEEGFLYALEHFILPVLADFKPDLVINSAGQDNHYTDPITNMRFSAQGYARLNDRLQPDIAVLEGGYSIEGALPYVNVGIILALAGLDYAGVREPDYSPAKVSQSPRVGDYIARLCEETYRAWQQRDALRVEFVRDKKEISRRRQIYYDTEGLMETQEETTLVCDACGGLTWIDSRTDLGSHVLAIFISRDACPRCREEGHALFDRVSSKSYRDGIFLQDRVADRLFKK
ncbi:histone deacetylase family protein [Moorella sulfitireducens]|uniref:histone deacetylase family protein n=1 Tax=Neomoorella sulfitireducens TaxID=2972948 RepID=UPI0021ABE200|nr:histone deacetylase [Moorella sulfitireducens]